MRIQLLGEGGGIGDTLRRLGVAQAVREAIPDADVWLFVLDALAPWAQLDGTTRTVAVPESIRRGISVFPNPDEYTYLRIAGPYDATLDLYDPAEAFENRAYAPINHNRTDIWIKHAAAVLGVPLSYRQPTLKLAPIAAPRAALRIQQQFRERPAQLVGLQPFSHWKWRSIGDDQACAIVTQLRERGAECMILHHKQTQIIDRMIELGARAVIGERPDVVVELARQCDALVTGDSALFHIGGLVGTPTLGLFAQTNGEAIGRDYSSCHAIVAGAAERAGLDCEFPCYRKAVFGCDKEICRRGCRALQRISVERVVDMVRQLVGDTCHG